MKRVGHCFLFATILGLSLGNVEPCAAEYGQADDLPVKTYASPSGQLTLRVDPSERSGSGKASYTVLSQGKSVWAGEQPITLWDAAIADDGTVAGYGYSLGPNQDSGDFVVAIFAPDGSIRMLDKSPRAWSHFLHTLANPKARGMFLDLENDRLVVRVDDPDLNASSESWWIWRIGDGKAIGKFKPREHMADAALTSFVLDARPVAGTPLTLIHWYRDGCKLTDCDNQQGARFTLVGADTKPVWTFDLPTDYTNSIDEDAQDRVFNEIREHGAILDTSRAGRFEIRQIAARQRLSFTVERDNAAPTRWKVSRIATAPYLEKIPKAPAPAAIKSVDLHMLGEIELGIAQADGESPIKSIYDFAVGEAGRFAFTTGCNCERAEEHALIVVDSDGALVRRIPLPAMDKEGATSDELAWISADRWLVTTSTFRSKLPTSVSWIDADTGKMERIDGFVDAQIEAMAASADGGFVVLTRKDEKHRSTAGLAAFNNKGKLRWSVDEGYPDESKLFSPADVALTAAGEAVVIDVIAKRLQVYAPDGTWLRNLDLKTLWGRKPNYPTGIETDAGGGVIVHDFQGNPPIVRMTLDGDIVSAFTPSYANGAKFDLRGNVQSAPDGRLWTSDGAALLRLDSNGKVDRIVGRKPDTASLGSIAALTVANNQEIYAVDERTGAVHVFDRKGLRRRLLEPAAGDYTGKLYDPSLAVMEDGNVYVARKGSGDERLDFLHYDPTGQRISVVSLPLNGEVHQDWYAQPGGSNRWIVGYDNVYRVDANGTVLRSLERDANGQWLDRPSLASVAGDGSIAVVSGGEPASLLGGAPAQARVTLFSARGDARETWNAPTGLSFRTGAIAYDGERLAFLVGAGGYEAASAVVITDLHGSPLLRYSPTPDRPPGQGFLVESEAGSELWLFDGTNHIDRYALPPNAAGKNSQP